MSGPACPSCQASESWERERPPLGAWGCLACGSHTCPRPSTVELIRVLNIPTQVMGDLARTQSRPSRFRCIGCGQGMVTFPIKGQPIDACIACGITVFGPGILEMMVPGMPAIRRSTPPPVSPAPFPSVGTPAGFAASPGQVPTPPTGSATRPTPPGATPRPPSSALTPAAGTGAVGMPAPGSPMGYGAMAEPPSSASGVPIPAGVGALDRTPSQTMAGVGMLSSTDSFRIRQQAKAGELIGIEQKNDYEIDLGVGGVAHACEDGGGAGGIIVRQIMGARRPLNFSVTDAKGEPVSRIRRPFYFWQPRTFVTDAHTGKPQGEVRRRFAVFSRRYDLLGPQGRVFAQIRAGLFKVFQFPLVGPDGKRPMGSITKTFGGVMREAFTDADNFTVELDAGTGLNEGQRTVVLATALGIDMDYFEKSSSSQAPIKVVVGLVVFLGFLLFNLIGSISFDGGGAGPGASSYGRFETAALCYASILGDRGCATCCEGDYITGGDGSCHCSGLTLECEDAAPTPSGCAQCCDDTMGPGGNESFLDADGTCRCEGSYNHRMMAGFGPTWEGYDKGK